MGSLEPLPGGNEFVGWGSANYFSEYNASGQMLLDAKLPSPDITYRALVEPWTGLPLDPPKGAARKNGGKTIVYASWNGATDVSSWRVTAGAHTVATVARSGFETTIAVPSNASAFAVQALDVHGHVLGTSRPFTAS
jgi:hypothetical protein